MWDNLIQYLAGRTRRERWLLGLLVFVALPMAAVYLAVLPMAQTREEARRSVSEAQALEAWVAVQATQYAARTAAVVEETAPVAGPIGISGIEKSLVAAGLRGDVSELANNGSGGITLRFDEVRFTVLMDWIASVSEAWGYSMTGFSFDRGEREDVVAAELRLAPAQ